LNRKNAIVFIADEIHSKGLELLGSNGFEVVKVLGLKNPELIKFISNFNSLNLTRKNPGLVIRSIRAFRKPDISSLKKLTGVRLLCTASSGFDNIDVAAAAKLGIDVLNVPEANYLSAAEHTIAMILAIVKNIALANSDMKAGLFDYKRYNNSELSGKTIGIIGVGHVGSQVAGFCRSFGMNILGNDIKKNVAAKYKWIKFVSKEKLLSESDFVTVHTPLDPTTKDMINSRRLKLIKKSAVVINCARGGIVNEKALIAALRSKRVGYAGLDVFESEPNFNKAFCKLPNVILTPHLAGKTAQSRIRISTQLAESIVRYYSGQKSTKVAPQ
jgi:D-3-phosphoglycerate dehydrogenase